ncbi:MAG: hypothetical protein LJE62_12020 [Silicimonas sp.]|nr:hypothetical protein [Silicimonas sp.]
MKPVIRTLAIAAALLAAAPQAQADGESRIAEIFDAICIERLPNFSGVVMLAQDYGMRPVGDGTLRGRGYLVNPRAKTRGGFQACTLTGPADNTRETTRAVLRLLEERDHWDTDTTRRDERYTIRLRIDGARTVIRIEPLDIGKMSLVVFQR